MSSQHQKIECPNCGHAIDVNDLLYHQVNEELKKKYNDDLARENNRVQSKLQSLNNDREALEKEKQEQTELIDSAIKTGVKKKESQLKTQLKQQLEDEQSEVMKSLNDELSSKSLQLKDFNKAKSDLEKVKREKDELKGAIEADAEKRLTLKLAEARETIAKNVEEQSYLKISEKEKIIEQLHQQLKDAQRKAEQGSVQLQGEVQELAIEKWLSTTFVLDTIEEIKKGARGADCLQTINTRGQQNCGTIYYESKRTKAFQAGWIEKFKNDIRDKNADIGVLVTECMPIDMKRMGQREGIWVCSFEEFKGLAVVLRESVVQLSDALTTQENKGEKMGMLYDFLTGNEFKLQIEAIVEGFTQMQSDLEAEKRAMQGIWKKREKQIQKVLLNTNHMYSSIKGIAGNAIQSIPLLELNDDQTPE
ncbi:MAG: DUF2130 domain-containing protein [Gammaproteobacteria bacterium]